MAHNSCMNYDSLHESQNLKTKKFDFPQSLCLPCIFEAVCDTVTPDPSRRSGSSS